MDTPAQTRTRGRELLTKGKIDRAKPTEKPRKLTDGGGLYLLINPNGARLWRLRYLHPTKRNAKGERVESMLSLGPYPEISLDKARARALAERSLIVDGVDPAKERIREKRGSTFEAIAREWLEKQQKVLAPVTYERTVWRFERLIFPEIGARPIASLTLSDITDLLSAIDKAGTHEEARRVYQRISRVFKYAKARGDVQANIALDVDRKEILSPRGKVKHHAAITDPVRIGELLRAIDTYSGTGVTKYALKLAPLLFVRPGELRHAEWAEFNLDGAEPQWLIPAEKMKMRRPHIVPLAKQAVALLRDLHKFTGHGKYVFPAMTGGSRPMSENTENAAIRRIGYSNTEHTAHGFRTMASTRLNEGFGKHRFKSDWIEMQLAHGEEDTSRKAYNAAEYLDDRRRMMQAYANYLDTLRAAKP